MKEHELRHVERRLKRRYFVIGVVATTVTLLLAGVFGPMLVASETDPRPFVALLPFLYAPVLLGGVAWLAWTSAAPRRGQG